MFLLTPNQQCQSTEGKGKDYRKKSEIKHIGNVNALKPRGK